MLFCRVICVALQVFVVHWWDIQIACVLFGVRVRANPSEVCVVLSRTV